jgi:hypothetical protein
MSAWLAVVCLREDRLAGSSPRRWRFSVAVGDFRASLQVGGQRSAAWKWIRAPSFQLRHSARESQWNEHEYFENIFAGGTVSELYVLPVSSCRIRYVATSDQLRD